MCAHTYMSTQAATFSAGENNCQVEAAGYFRCCVISELINSRERDRMVSREIARHVYDVPLTALRVNSRGCNCENRILMQHWAV